MRRLQWFFFLLAFAWSVNRISTAMQTSDARSMFDSRVTVKELSLVVHVVVVVLGCVVLLRFLLILFHAKNWKQAMEFMSRLNRREVLLISTLSVVPQPSLTALQHQPSASVPLRSVIEPAVAIALVVRLFQGQRANSLTAVSLTRLTEDSAQTLSELRQYAVEAHRNGVLPRECSEQELDDQLAELVTEEPLPPNVISSWEVVIRMYGYPYVENRHGARAEFGKKRSVEVLAWLGMNLDRPRRSAVRTALWDVEISDASFSTVMSDIRRGISSVAYERDRKDVFPPTFTDSIEIGVDLITDFDLLRQALNSFRESKAHASLLAAELSHIRDVPFAGANYMWADLDGTTTRMVVLALQASCELAEWARETNNMEMCSIAVKAGLRVMPGHEELLAIQHSFISPRSMSRG